MILDNIWVINLEKDNNRLELIKNNLNNLGLTFKRFDAVNANLIPYDTLVESTTKLCRTLLCNKGIVGCGLSHINLWKQLLNEKNTEVYLILEDDAILNDKSKDILKKIETNIDINKYDIINLHCYNIGCGFQKEFEIDEYSFGKPYFPLTFTGYIITKKGVKKMLQYFDKINYHIDYQISKNLLNTINYYTVYPNIIDSYILDTSLTDKNNSCVIYLLNTFGLNYIAWVLNIPLLTILLFFSINLLLLILLLILIINNVTIKNNLINWFLLFELVIYIFNFL